jgi:predicted Zn-dependent protease
MQGGDSSLNEMVKNTKKGIYVTHFHYTNTVNPRTLQITGLTRDGTFMIEDGKITSPIHNMRFTESLLDAFSNITALSKDLALVNVFGSPSLVPAATIENFHFTSGQK